jgi:hypothetical protein
MANISLPLHTVHFVALHDKVAQFNEQQIFELIRYERSSSDRSLKDTD